jgi:hypothetical protein
MSISEIDSKAEFLTEYKNNYPITDYLKSDKFVVDKDWKDIDQINREKLFEVIKEFCDEFALNQDGSTSSNSLSEFKVDVEDLEIWGACQGMVFVQLNIVPKIDDLEANYSFAINYSFRISAWEIVMTYEDSHGQLSTHQYEIGISREDTLREAIESCKARFIDHLAKVMEEVK